MKTYTKTHKLEKAAKNHLKKIQSKGGSGKIEKKGDSFKLSYSFPSKNEAYFTEFKKDSNWVHGKIENYDFEAKLFDEDSIFGINKGRVSKLHVWDKKTNKDIITYDRGWDIKPNKDTKSYFDAIMMLLENSPKRFS